MSRTIALSTAGQYTDVVAALLDQLRQLHEDLRHLVDCDPEQEVTGIAFTLVDQVIAEARSWLPVDSSLRNQVPELVSIERVV